MLGSRAPQAREIPSIQVRAEFRLKYFLMRNIFYRRARLNIFLTNWIKLYIFLSQHHFVLEVVDKKIVDERYARLKAPVRPSRRLPEQESFSVDLAYCSIDFLVHWSQVFPSDFRRKNQTAVLVIRVEPCRGPRSNQ